MKKLIVGLLPLVATMLCAVSAGNIEATHPTEQPACNSDESKTINVYMTGDTYMIYPYDAYWNSDSDVLINNKTSVQIRDNGVISGCDNWVLMSNYIRKGHPSQQNNRALLLRTENDSGCILYKPNQPRNNASDIDATIHYTIGFKKKGNDGSLLGKFYYRTVGNIEYNCLNSNGQYTTVNNVSSCPDITVGYKNTQEYHKGECLNYRIFRCGDGILDKEHEECDPEHPDYKGKDICDPETCKISGKLHIEKTLIGKKTVEKTGEKLTWEVRVWATSGDVTDFRIEDIVPAALEYDSYTVKKNDDHLTVNNPTGPVNSSNGDRIYTWDVKGTLKKNHELIIVVNTVVIKMPKSDEDYRNVACVINDGEKSCDDAKPETGKPVIEKTLTGKKMVESTGEILTWDIRVTASGGGVTDFDIKDIIPFPLEYYSSTIIKNTADLTVTGPSSPERVATGNVYTWNVKGTLGIKDELVLEVKTKVVEMPKKEDDHKNVACVIKEGYIDCDNDKPTEGVPHIQKTLIDKIPVDHTGQQLDWNVKVTAKGGDITDFVISDIVPRELNYKGREIGENEDGLTVKYRDGASHGTGNGAEVHYWDVIGTLENGNSLTIKVKTEVKEMPDPSKDIENIACVQLSGSDYVECDNDKTGNPKLRIKKHILSGNNLVKVKTGVKVGDKITYRIDFGNSGDVEGTIVSIKDFLPKNVKYLNSEIFIVTGANSSSEQVGTGIVGTYQVSDGVYIDIFGGITLQPGQRGYIIITGEILSDFPDQRTNFACIYDDDDLIACDDASHKPEEDDGYKCKSLTINPKSFSNGKGTSNVTCTTTSGRKANIEIDCGSGATVRYITGSNVSELTGKCSYTTKGSYSVVCKVDGENPPKSCTGTVNVSKGGPGPDPTPNPTCENAELNGNNVTCEASRAAYFRVICEKSGGGRTIKGPITSEKDVIGKIKIDDTSCDGVLRCQVTNDRYSDSWRSSNACIIKEESNPEGEHECINVNAGNFSIEEGEIFPFYWNLANMDEIVEYNDKSYYTTISNTTESYKNAIDNYDNPPQGCNDEGKIALDSMVCTFNIYNGSGHRHLKDYDEKPLYTIKGPCLSKEKVIGSNKSNLVNAWYNKMWDEYCSKNSCEIDYREIELPTAVYYIQNFGKDDAGVHLNVGNWEGSWDMENNGNKSREVYGEYKIELTKVEYLQCEGNGWVKKSPDIDPCQGNFMLTNSYTVQKTPSGNLTASIKELSKYYKIDGTQPFVGYLKAIQTTDYKENNKVEDAMNVFISKYSKLAVKVGKNDSKFLKDGGTLKKVPGKSIYFVDGDLTIVGGKEIKNPFTIVQTNGNTTIQGDVGHNMMLLTKGNITFKGDCEKIQNVKGIFYARGSLSRSGVNKNDDINHSYWCTKGGLYVKGVLIGDGFDTLMKNSRSNINNWFNVDRDTNTSDNQRRDIIMNGASVVIEYSPSIFTKSTMPPGAEDFTTALSIYKN